MSVLLSSDKLYPDSVTKLNTKFDEVDASLATKLDKSGGTMTGDIAMGTHKITGLPSPSGAGEPSVYGHNHDERYYSESEIDAQVAGLGTAINTVNDALAAHKTGGDHDSRYLSTGYLSSLVRTTLDQVIDGIKTFIKDLTVKKASPAVELLHSDGTQLARLWASSLPEAMLRLEVGNGGGYTTVLEALQGLAEINYPNHVVKAKGVRLATIDDVAASIRSGSAYAVGQTGTVNAGTTGYCVVGSNTQLFVVPPGRRITGIAVAVDDGGGISTWSAAVSLSASVVKVGFSIPGGGGNVTVLLKDENNTTIFSQAPGAELSVTGNSVCSVTLTMSV